MKLFFKIITMYIVLAVVIAMISSFAQGVINPLSLDERGRSIVVGAPIVILVIMGLIFLLVGYSTDTGDH